MFQLLYTSKLLWDPGLLVYFVISSQVMSPGSEVQIYQVHLVYLLGLLARM